MFKAKNQQFYIFEKNSDLSLAEYLIRSEKRPDLNFLKKVAFDLLSTLKKLHNRGIVHLDLNPNNIIVINEQELSLNSDESSSESDCQVIQSGGAPINPAPKKIRKSLFNITNFFMSSGIDKKKFSSNKISSLYFMAPERILAEADINNIDQLKKCDMWSIGVLMYFLLFGDFPFDGENTSKLARSIRSGHL